MDVHNDAIAVAYVAQAHGAEVLSLGAFGTRQGDMDQLLRKRQAQATPLLFGSAAGPCGYWLYRYLMKTGSDCWGLAPSLIPQKPGDRVKTDCRDAVQLARRARSGDLTAVSVPPVAEAAMRDRTRAREAASSDLKDAQLRLTAVLRRHDIRYVSRAHGGRAHLRWLSEVVCPRPAPHIVCQEYVRAISEPHERLQRLEHALPEPVTAGRVFPVLDALQAWRGVQCPVAVTLGADMGDLTRCERPRELMKCMGLIPAEPSSGAKRQQGSIPKAGNTHARRVLVEGAWA
jgi:transposase